MAVSRAKFSATEQTICDRSPLLGEEEEEEEEEKNVCLRESEDETETPSQALLNYDWPRHPGDSSTYVLFPDTALRAPLPLFVALLETLLQLHSSAGFWFSACRLDPSLSDDEASAASV